MISSGREVVPHEEQTAVSEGPPSVLPWMLLSRVTARRFVVTLSVP
jgi:hypothetical protein